MQKLTSVQSVYIREYSGCPDCYHQLMIGPRGGLAINVKCSNCEHEFNIPPPPFLVERINK